MIDADLEISYDSRKIFFRHVITALFRMNDDRNDYVVLIFEIIQAVDFFSPFSAGVCCAEASIPFVGHE